MTALFAEAGFALAAGAVTFFSPCAYALLPGYVGYYASTGEATVSGSFVRGVAATLGVLAVFSSLFGVSVVVGESVGDYLLPLEVGVGVALFALGVALVADIDFGWHTRLPKRGSGIVDFFAFGVAYSVAAAGCVAPLFVSVVLRSLVLPTAASVVTLGVYAAAFSALMLGATVATAAGYELCAERLPGYTERATRYAGVVVALAGVAQVYVSLTVVY